MKNYLKYKLKEFKEEAAFKRSFPDKAFQAIDKALKQSYLLQNPYRVSKQFLEKRGDEDIHQYGETPLRTMYKIAYAAGITNQDHFIELGAGRGRTAFFVSHYFRCRVTGIEQIPLFVNKAEKVAISHSLIEPRFRCEDFLKTNLSDATVIYCNGTCLSDHTIFELCKKIPENCKTISVSYPLRDYDNRFHILKKIKARYLWGETEVFIESCDHSVGMRSP